MLYDYRKESKSPMLLTLANGKTIEGEFIDLRIATDTLPKGKLWYHIRHTGYQKLLISLIIQSKTLSKVSASIVLIIKLFRL